MVGLWATVGTSVISSLLMVITGDLFFLLCLAALGPGAFSLVWGAPRRIEVGHDEAVVYSWLGAPLRSPTSALSAHYSDFELALAWDERRMILSAEQFPGDSLDACVRALAEHGARVVDARLERRASFAS